jgi:hypothetical protein
VNVVAEVHPLKQRLPSVVAEARLKLVILEHPSKHELPITEATGKLIEIKAVQPLKAVLPIVPTFERVTVASEAHNSNEPDPNSTRALPASLIETILAELKQLA